jgi:hypothetical protein
LTSFAICEVETLGVVRLDAGDECQAGGKSEDLSDTAWAAAGSKVRFCRGLLVDPPPPAATPKAKRMPMPNTHTYLACIPRLLSPAVAR